MKRVVLTGSSGRIGRAIFGALASEYRVAGIDRNTFSTTHIVGDCAEPDVIAPALEGADAVIHTAGPHAPHVGILSDGEFERVNVEGTRTLFNLAAKSGVKRFVYTSTTALYGNAIVPGECTWVTDETQPAPKSIYHRTNLAAEAFLEEAASHAMPVRVMRMSRCFPEPAPTMALLRLHRGVDARGVGTCHRLALTHEGAPFERFIISGATPFGKEDCNDLAASAADVIRERVPDLARAFDARGWSLPDSVDRVYDATAAREALGWKQRWGWEEVLAQWDRDSIEVLAPE
ncbi:epimerase [Erythrobacter sp. KY5]|uniref:NAD-dependent epimerase/dehydratase family protein n=1 Tax=Erythrobacter sp. KY5 TaxID=2011159 RepID=UPI000DBF06EA|nr:NAD(P)-dependent oxidoreductase [Erythrobacter sp. KY5]AWW75841.1 epimerase [Erythrobacter sp. KY5]